MDPQQNSGDPNAPAQGSQFVDYSQKTAPVNIIDTPPPVEVPSTPPSEPAMPPPRDMSGFSNTSPVQSHHGSRKLFAVIAIIIVVLAVGAYGVYAFMVSPSAAVPMALRGFDSAKKITSTFNIQVSSSNKQIDGASLSVTNELDRTNASTVAGQSDLTASASGYSVGAEMRVVNNVLYGELTSAPAAYDAMLAAYKNKWFSISLDALKSYASSTVGSYNVDPMGMHASVADLYSKLLDAGVITAPALQGVGFSGGSLVKTYTFSINKDSLAKYIADTMSAQMGSSTESSVMTRAYVVGALSTVDFSPITVTADFWSGSLRSFAVDVNVSAPATSYTPATSATTHVNGTYDPSATSFTITAPSGATSLDSYFTSLESSVQGAQNNSKNTHIISDLNQMRLSFESSWKNGAYTSTCQSPSLASYKADIQSYGSVFYCHANSQAYSLTANLLTGYPPDPKKAYYCFDSNSIALYLSKPPAGYACK